MNLHTPERGAKESVKEYKERRAKSKYAAKLAQKCWDFLWDSSRKGTYIKAKHGHIGSRA